MYVEASFPRQAGDKAVLMTPPFSAPTQVGCVMTFWYHMQGAGQGKLDVLVVLDTIRNYSAFDTSGDQGPSWKLGQIRIPVGTHNKDFQVNQSHSPSPPAIHVYANYSEL